MKHPYKIDVPVALIFFNRPTPFQKVFDCVKRERPSKLFLIQDGPRATSKTDIDNIKACRKICNEIDWDCEVIKIYSDENLGCGRRIFSGLSEAFKHVDRLVIIEDDIMFSESFLPFCAELLEKYKNDQRIHQISGMNHISDYQDCNNSYFFSRGGAIWGWATWKRVWDEIDWDLVISEDEYISKTLVRNKFPRDYGTYLTSKAKDLRNLISNGKAPSYWSFHLLYYSYIQNRLNIVPKKNLISNIGITADSAHADSNLNKFSKRTQRVFFTKMQNLEFPLKHPSFVLDDRYYKQVQDEVLYPTGLAGLLDKIEVHIRRLIYR